MEPVNLIVSCSNRKKAAPPTRLRARSLRSTSLQDRLDEWLDRRTTCPVGERPASDLYAGDHWHVAQSIPQSAAQNGLQVRLWVCSAGYGLVASTDPVKPYSITFTPRHVDSIFSRADGAPNATGTHLWWAGLCNHSGTVARASIASLADREPSVPLVVVASEPYLQAMRHDLIAAARALGSDDLLSILSVGGNPKRLPELAPCFLPADARLEAVVGGTRAALNARITRVLFQELDEGGAAGRPQLEAALQRLSVNLPPLRRFDRSKLSDAEVRRFIDEERQANPAASKSWMLRKLRADGAACEQKRFSEIFHQSIEEAGDGA